MQINLVFTPSTAPGYQAFVAAVKTAANMLDEAFSDPITVNLSVGYGEVTFNGQQKTLDSGEAEGGPTDGLYENYASTRSLLLSQLSPDVLSSATALPLTSRIQSQSQVVIWSAEAKALGLIDPNQTSLDGAAGFATDIPADRMVGVALHELTHAMGRAPASGTVPDIFDLDRFTSTGTRLFGAPAAPAPASYFSIDNGVTDLADYGQTSDPGDWLSTTGRTPNDAFNEYYNSNTLQSLSPVDLLQMEALGFHLQTAQASYAVSDLNGDHHTDVVMRTAGGDWGYYSAGATWVDAGGSAANYAIAGTGDFNGDGLADVVFRNNATGAWGYAASTYGQGSPWVYAGLSDHNYALSGVADFNGDGIPDVVFRNDATGEWGYAAMTHGQGDPWVYAGLSDPNYVLAGVGDFNGDGIPDVVFRNNTTGEWGYAAMSHGQGDPWVYAGLSDTRYTMNGVGDFNGDGIPDVLMSNASNGDWGYVAMTHGQGTAWVDVGTLPSGYGIAGVGDYNGDGVADVLIRNNTTGAWGYEAFTHAGSYWQPLPASDPSYFVA